jgi:hypothetical protein
MHRLQTLLVLCCSAAVVGCGERQRPFPEAVTGPSFIEVHVLEPLSLHSPVAVAGQSLQIRIRASDRAGRLTGLGFVARRTGAVPVRVDSVMHHFAPRIDTTLTLSIRAPTEFGNNAQVDIIAIALAAGNAVGYSEPQAVLVVHCPPAAVWCR